MQIGVKEKVVYDSACIRYRAHHSKSGWVVVEYEDDNLADNSLGKK